MPSMIIHIPLRERPGYSEKNRAYHETSEVHVQMVLQVPEVLHRPVAANLPVLAVPSTVEALFAAVFMEGMHSLISHRGSFSAKH